MSRKHSIGNRLGNQTVGVVFVGLIVSGFLIPLPHESRSPRGQDLTSANQEGHHGLAQSSSRNPDPAATAPPVLNLKLPVPIEITDEQVAGERGPQERFPELEPAQWLPLPPIPSSDSGLASEAEDAQLPP